MLVQFFKLIIVFSTLFLSGCSVKSPPPPSSDIDKLTTLLLSLNRDIPKQEAQKLAIDIYQRTNNLIEEFELVSPPLLHNFLVNIGIRKKGLCYHWSDALFVYLKNQNYPSFEFHLVGANIGKYWSEHNSIVIISKENKRENSITEDGIIIDPWRNSGKLYYSQILKDREYKWSSRVNRESSVLSQSK